MYTTAGHRHTLVTTVLVATLATLVVAGIGAASPQSTTRTGAHASASGPSALPQLPEIVVTAMGTMPLPEMPAVVVTAPRLSS